MLWQTERLILCAASFILAACKLPEVPITTPKPLEVNLNMRLDVYQYRGDEPQDKEALKNASEATERMRNRMQEIQTLKNNQLVSEDHRGLLQIREVPAGDWGAQVKKAVAAENEDRMLLMRQKAKEANRPLYEIEGEQWRLRSEQAEPGEWIEIPGSTPGSFELKRVDAKTTPPASQPTTTTPPIPATPKP
ncbi:MAG: DUF1318 domain-containing protein [Prosthecobacter sp.]|uniref:DUF1318 domain-containing protein n=1 Tax=Prosthecobacter sp. TaxID=1965333 RepID=UPI003BB155F9